MEFEANICVGGVVWSSNEVFYDGNSRNREPERLFGGNLKYFFENALKFDRQLRVVVGFYEKSDRLLDICHILLT